MFAYLNFNIIHEIYDPRTTPSINEYECMIVRHRDIVTEFPYLDVENEGGNYMSANK